MEYSILNKDSFYDFLVHDSEWKIPLVEDENCGREIFQGFDFFAPDTILSTPTAYFFIAKDGQEPTNICGVLKLGVYTYFEMTPEYWAINYINVRRDMRKQGIATKLYKTLNGFLQPDDFLVSSTLSELGKKARLNDLRKRIIRSCPSFDTKDCFLEYCIKNNLQK